MINVLFTKLIFLNVYDDVLYPLVKALSSVKNPLIAFMVCVSFITYIIVNRGKKVDIKDKKSYQTVGSNKDINLDEIVSENQRLIANNKSEKVINNLLRLDLQEGKDNMLQDVLLISAQFSKYKSDTIKGLEANDIRLNEINHKLLQVLDNIRDNNYA